MNNQQPNQIEALINHYNLLPHPEGGFFRQTYAAAELISMPVRKSPLRNLGAFCFSLFEFFISADQW